MEQFEYIFFLCILTILLFFQINGLIFYIKKINKYIKINGLVFKCTYYFFLNLLFYILKTNKFNHLIVIFIKTHFNLKSTYFFCKNIK